MGDRLLLFLALRDGQPIAGALNLIGPDTLYGRYWGTIEEVPFLHFELCYYQAIEWAIANGLAYVQAGAQGEHKLARGYEPVITRSAHFIADPGFRGAVAQFLDEERQAIAAEIEWLRGPCPTACPRRRRSRRCAPSRRRPRRDTSPRVVKPQARFAGTARRRSARRCRQAALMSCKRSVERRLQRLARQAGSARRAGAPATARMKYSPDPVAETAAERSSA